MINTDKYFYNNFSVSVYLKMDIQLKFPVSKNILESPPKNFLPKRAWSSYVNSKLFKATIFDYLHFEHVHLSIQKTLRFQELRTFLQS